MDKVTESLLPPPRPDDPRKSAPVRCRDCADTGWKGVYTPCSCEAGLPHQRYKALAQSPPACVDCGGDAYYCLESETPRCVSCDRTYNLTHHGTRSK